MHRFYLPLCFSLIFVFSAEMAVGQKARQHDFIVWETGDTAWCTITCIERVSGNVRKIDYVNPDNRKIELRDKYELSKARFISVNNEFFWEYLPVKAKRPVLWRHLEIELNGKIKIYANRQLTLKVKEDGTKYIADPTAKFGGISRTIKLDNGKYLDITPATIQNEIAPYLSGCPTFKNSFGEKMTKRNVVRAVKEYNQVCK